MNCDRGRFLHSFGVWTVPVCGGSEGSLRWATFSGHRLVCGRTVWILTMMQSCASAANSGRRAHSPGRHRCHVRIRFPATSDRQFGSRHKGQPERRVGMGMLFRSLQPAGRRMTPSNVSPVVTKRQSAMISLRASATIMVLRVPLRLSAVRARYHNASALCF
jgi:hypothetical protein